MGLRGFHSHLVDSGAALAHRKMLLVREPPRIQPTGKNTYSCGKIRKETQAFFDRAIWRPNCPLQVMASFNRVEVEIGAITVTVGTLVVVIRLLKDWNESNFGYYYLVWSNILTPWIRPIFLRT